MSTAGRPAGRGGGGANTAAVSASVCLDSHAGLHPALPSFPRLLRRRCALPCLLWWHDTTGRSPACSLALPRKSSRNSDTGRGLAGLSQGAGRELLAAPCQACWVAAWPVLTPRLGISHLVLVNRSAHACQAAAGGHMTHLLGARGADLSGGDAQLGVASCQGGLHLQRQRQGGGGAGRGGMSRAEHTGARGSCSRAALVAAQQQPPGDDRCCVRRRCIKRGRSLVPGHADGQCPKGVRCTTM